MSSSYEWVVEAEDPDHGHGGITATIVFDMAPTDDDDDDNYNDRNDADGSESRRCRPPQERGGGGGGLTGRIVLGNGPRSDAGSSHKSTGSRRRQRRRSQFGASSTTSASAFVGSGAGAGAVGRTFSPYVSTYGAEDVDVDDGRSANRYAFHHRPARGGGSSGGSGSNRTSAGSGSSGVNEAVCDGMGLPLSPAMIHSAGVAAAAASIGGGTGSMSTPVGARSVLAVTPTTSIVVSVQQNKKLRKKLQRRSLQQAEHQHGDDHRSFSATVEALARKAQQQRLQMEQQQQARSPNTTAHAATAAHESHQQPLHHPDTLSSLFISPIHQSVAAETTPWAHAGENRSGSVNDDHGATGGGSHHPFSNGGVLIGEDGVQYHFLGHGGLQRAPAVSKEGREWEKATEEHTVTSSSHPRGPHPGATHSSQRSLHHALMMHASGSPSSSSSTTPSPPPPPCAPLTSSSTSFAVSVAGVGGPRARRGPRRRSWSERGENGNEEDDRVSDDSFSGAVTVEGEEVLFRAGGKRKRRRMASTENGDCGGSLVLGPTAAPSVGPPVSLLPASKADMREDLLASFFSSTRLEEDDFHLF